MKLPPRLGLSFPQCTRTRMRGMPTGHWGLLWGLIRAVGEAEQYCDKGTFSFLLLSFLGPSLPYKRCFGAQEHHRNPSAPRESVSPGARRSEASEVGLGAPGLCKLSCSRSRNCWLCPGSVARRLFDGKGRPLSAPQGPQPRLLIVGSQSRRDRDPTGDPTQRTVGSSPG